MSDRMDHEDNARALDTFGADLSRWPKHRVGAAREALLADPGFRRAWEAERDLDSALNAHRDSLDREIDLSGAAERVRRRVLGSIPAAVLGRLHWRRMAAAMVVAGALGGAMNLALPEQAAEASDLRGLDPLLSLHDTALR